METSVRGFTKLIWWSTIMSVALLLVSTMPAWSATYVSGPGTLDRSGETYVVTQDFSCSGTAFVIGASNVVLDLGGHTITYGTGGATSYGVWLPVGYESPTRNAAANSEIKNGTLTQHPASAAVHCYGVYSRYAPNTAGPIIHDLTINTHSVGSMGIHLDDAGLGVQIYNCVLNTSNVPVSIDEGCPAIQLANGPFGTATSRALIHHNTVNGAQKGVDLSAGPTYVDVYSNQIHHVAPPANAKASYGVGCWSVAYCRIYDNVISTQHGMGILLQYGSEHNEIYGNNIDVADDQPDEWNHAVGIRLRHGGSYNKIHDNTVIARSVNTAFASQELKVFNMGDSIDEDFEHGVPDNNEIYRNTFTCLWNADMNAARVCCLFGRLGTGNSFHDNTLISNTWPVSFQEPSVGTLEFKNNRIEKGPNPNGGWATFLLWNGSQGHRVVDVSLGPGVYLTGNYIRWGSGTNSLQFEWTTTITVKDTAGSAVAGATVTITDCNGTTEYTGTTNASGQVGPVLKQKLLTQGVPTNYTPHTVRVTKTGYSDGTATVTVDASKSATVTIESSSSSGPTIHKQVDPQNAVPGQTITYTITYSNQTGGTIRNVVITDQLPASVQYVAGSVRLNGAPVTPDPYSNGSLAVPVGDLAAGVGGTITFDGKVR